MHLFLFVLECLGGLSFAVSGAFAAVKKQMDWFGALVLACVTTFGGGLFRDLILRIPPIGFFDSTYYVLLCILGTAIVLIFGSHVEKQNKLIMWFDSIGLAIFTASGTMRALNAGAPWSGAIMLAVVTACGGGMMRDILRNEKPFVLYTDFYASASMLGSAFLVLMLHLNVKAQVASTTCIIIVFIIRMLVLFRQWDRERKKIRQQLYSHHE